MSTSRSEKVGLLREFERISKRIDLAKLEIERLEPKRNELRQRILQSLGAATPVRKVPMVSRPGWHGVRQAVDAVREIGGDVDAQQVAEKLGVSIAAVRMRFRRACMEGLLCRVSHGRYRLTEATSPPDAKVSQEGANRG